MNVFSGWLKELGAAAMRWFERFLDFAPTLLVALLVLVAGWVAARLLRAVCRRFLLALNRLFDRFFQSGPLSHLRFSAPAIKLIGSIVFWIVILLVVAAASRILGLAPVTALLDKLLASLPTLVTGAVIIFVGVVASLLARDLSVGAAEAAGVSQSRRLGAAVQVTILAIAVIVGLDEMNVDVSLLTTIVAIAFGAVLGSLSLAFAFGARGFVANLVASRYVARQYRPGDTVRVGDIEGLLHEVTPTSVILTTEKGRVHVPTRIFTEQITTVVAGDGGD